MDIDHMCQSGTELLRVDIAPFLGTITQFIAVLSDAFIRQ